MEPKDTKPKPSLRRKSHLNEENITSLDSFIPLVQKERDKRTPHHIKQMVAFLSSNYKYFIDLKKTADHDLMERLVSSLNYEFFRKGERIINCGDEGNKFYILLKGKVSVHKPIPHTAVLSFREYVEFIWKIKYKEKNDPKFNRITNQNAQIDHFSLYKMNYNYKEIKQSRIKQKYVLEEEKKLAELTDGFYFGEMALIKKEPRNASIFAEEDSTLVSLDKYDYNKVIRELEEKRLLALATEFKRQYPLFIYWGINQLYRLFNYFEKESISFGEYLYKQNQPSDYIYFLDNGSFEMTSLFSFAWYEEFIDFIHDTTHSVVNKIHQRDIFDNDDNFNELLREGFSSTHSPCVINKRAKKTFHQPEGHRESVLDVKLEQDNMKNPKHLHNVTIKQLSIPECLGYEDALELKPRFTSVRCLSTLVEFRKVSLVQFIKLLPWDPTNQYVLLRNIFEKKSFLIQQLKNNAMFQMSSIDYLLKEKFIKAIKKQYPFVPKTYVNDKKMIKTFTKEGIGNESGVNDVKDKQPEVRCSSVQMRVRKPKLTKRNNSSMVITSKQASDNMASSLMPKGLTREGSQLKQKKVKTNQSQASFPPITYNNDTDHEIEFDKCKKELAQVNWRIARTSREMRKHNSNVERSQSSTRMMDDHSSLHKKNTSSLMNRSGTVLIMNKLNDSGGLNKAFKETSLLMRNKKNKGWDNGEHRDYSTGKRFPQFASHCLEAIAMEKENKKCFLKLQNKRIFLKMKNNESG